MQQRYTVQHPYRSYRDGQLFGPWQAGDEVELDEPAAEWINRDSPGTLAAADQAEPEAQEESTPEVEAEPEPEKAPAPRRSRAKR